MRAFAPILAALRWMGLIKAKSESVTSRQGRSYLETTAQSSRLEINPYDRQEAVRKSRHWVENSDILNVASDKFETYVVGTGLPLNPASDDPKWNQLSKRVWDDWTRHPDIASRLDLAGVLRVVAKEWFADGDILIIKTRANEIGLDGQEYSRPRIQLIRSHRIMTPPRKERNEMIHDGVEIDENGNPIAYWVQQESTDGSGRPEFTRVRAEDCIFVYEPEYADQLRGLPMAYPVLDEIHDRADLQLLEMKAARDAAQLTNIWKTESGEIPLEVMRRTTFSQTITNNDDTTTTEKRLKLINDSTGGRTVALKPNEDLIQNRSDRPSVVTMDYWRHLEEKICAGIGIPRMLLYPPSQMNGTTYRGALDMAAAYFRARSTVIARVEAQIYEFVITEERKRNIQLASLPGNWRKVSIRPPRAPNVDVGRNAQAEIASLAAGTTNLDLIYGPLGLDWKEQIDALSEQIKYARSKGVDLAGMLAANPQNGQQSPNTRKELVTP